ncbi:MAG TPA: hypothetical protein VFS43_30440 [Polyangiaceae bacterium]|nr:hypothetical protein [Polyangiaceae bacterium]
MSELTVIEVKRDEFKTRTELCGRSVAAAFIGTADMLATKDLERYVRALEAEVRRLAVCEVVVDMRELYFMNSHCLKLLVSWIVRAEALAPPQRCTFLFRTHRGLPWQRRTLLALTALAESIVRVEEA